MTVKRIPVGILGATGLVGQKFVELLANHPWFEIVALAASERSQGKPYAQASSWLMSTPLPDHLAKMTVSASIPTLPCSIVFSALDSDVAYEIESNFAANGYAVISNAKNFRMDHRVPLLIPDVNPEHLELIEAQNFGRGCIVTNPNCSTIGIATAIKPLHDLFGIDSLQVTTLQSISGAGYPGLPSLSILDNVIPWIQGEEEKIETEPLKILGSYSKELQSIEPSTMRISAQCTRVPVSFGHLACISIKLKTLAEPLDVIKAWNTFYPESRQLNLPSAPSNSIHYFSEEHFPQPKLHRDLGQGMTVSVGRLRLCSLQHFKFVVLSHNIIRGAAGGAILIAELMLKKGYLKRFMKEFSLQSF